MSDTHEHSYEYLGVVYNVQTYAVPGTGAKDIYYYDRYVCSACLDAQYHRLSATTTTYERIQFDATPAPVNARLEHANAR